MLAIPGKSPTAHACRMAFSSPAHHVVPKSPKVAAYRPAPRLPALDGHPDVSLRRSRVVTDPCSPRDPPTRSRRRRPLCLRPAGPARWCRLPLGKGIGENQAGGAEERHVIIRPGPASESKALAVEQGVIDSLALASAPRANLLKGYGRSVHGLATVQGRMARYGAPARPLVHM